MVLWIVIMWPISGWVFFFLAVPQWMLDTDPFGYLLGFICGAVVGPFGSLWLLEGNRWEK